MIPLVLAFLLLAAPGRRGEPPPGAAAGDEAFFRIDYPAAVRAYDAATRSKGRPACPR